TPHRYSAPPVTPPFPTRRSSDLGGAQAGVWFLNSAFVSISVTVLQLFCNSLAAYVFAKRRFPGRSAIFLLFLATMMVPPQVTMKSEEHTSELQSLAYLVCRLLLE